VVPSVLAGVGAGKPPALPGDDAWAPATVADAAVVDVTVVVGVAVVAGVPAEAGVDAVAGLAGPSTRPVV
jgi:hypothetical protein